MWQALGLRLCCCCCRAREKRLREAAEERRMKELRKKAQEDAEEEERQKVRKGCMPVCAVVGVRSPGLVTGGAEWLLAPPLLLEQVAREMFQKEKELQEERAREERRIRIEAQQKEEERIRKTEEHRLATQKVGGRGQEAETTLKDGELKRLIWWDVWLQILAEQQAQIKKKMEEMAELERIRLAKVRTSPRLSIASLHRPGFQH